MGSFVDTQILTGRFPDFFPEIKSKKQMKIRQKKFMEFCPAQTALSYSLFPF